MPVRLDLRALPLVRINYVGDYSDAEMAEFLGSLDRVLERPGRKVGLIDLLDATVSAPSQRKRHAEWIASNETALRRDFAACAIVLDNALLRGAVTAIFWIQPLPLPTQITATVDEALAWVEPYLEQL